MEFPSLCAALIEHFGHDSRIESPEDESDAWKSIVRGCKDGQYVGLTREIERLLTHSDQEIFELFNTWAPAWECNSPADARYPAEGIRR